MDHRLWDLYGHQAWADAEHWRAALALPDVLADAAWFERQHHIHLVQRAFLAIVQGREVKVSEARDFTPESLLANARRYHAEVAAYLADVSDARLGEVLDGIPWFQDPPIRLTVGEALLQAAMHSQHHRAQNATRLRELGGEPPTTDYIVWIWQDRPAPQWPE